jgi:hypothetical protein
MAMTDKTKSALAGAGVGGGGAIALAGPFKVLAFFYFGFEALPEHVQDAWSIILVAIFGLVLTIIGSWIARFFTGMPPAGGNGGDLKEVSLDHSQTAGSHWPNAGGGVDAGGVLSGTVRQSGGESGGHGS